MFKKYFLVLFFDLEEASFWIWASGRLSGAYVGGWYQHHPACCATTFCQCKGQQPNLLFLSFSDNFKIDIITEGEPMKMQVISQIILKTNCFSYGLLYLNSLVVGISGKTLTIRTKL